MVYRATKHPVFNRGIAPDSFLDELLAWGKSAPNDIFAPNHNQDVYSSVVRVLGPYDGVGYRRDVFGYRRAVMLEVMRVLAGFESSWNWNQGSDQDADHKAARQHRVRRPAELEAGAWQVSADSIGHGPELQTLVLRKVGSVEAAAFQRAMKQDHNLAMEYIARLLRRTVRANGPVLHHRIDQWLRRDAVREFEACLYPIGDFPSPPASTRLA
jgi:hypothetical protein